MVIFDKKTDLKLQALYQLQH